MYLRMLYQFLLQILPLFYFWTVPHNIGPLGAKYSENGLYLSVFIHPSLSPVIPVSLQGLFS